MEPEKLMESFADLYRTYGYRHFRMSKFEKYELYAGYKDFLVSDRVITFNDTTGELLALKPDVTLSIVRSTEYHAGQKQKLCYRERVYRPAGSEHRFQEITQCGLECIGDLDGYDVYEVLHLAGESLCMISADRILSVSHLGIVNCLMDALQADEPLQQTVLQLIASRNLHELTELFRQQNWSQPLLSDIRELLSLNCTMRELPQCIRAFGMNWIADDLLRELEELGSLITEDDQTMRFDFSVINDIHYYNGIVFQGFVQGISEKVLSGGRYDSLLRRMNKKGSAIGFAVYCGLLEQIQSAESGSDTDVLLLYDSETSLLKVRDTVRQLQAEGCSVSAQRSTAGSGRRVVDLRGGDDHA